MKKITLRLFALITLLGLLVGCSSTSDRSSTAGMVAPQAPPPPKTESVGVSPGPMCSWVSGYWAYHDNQWGWVPGGWQVRPTGTSAWVPGHWDQTGEHSWAWTPGRWQ